MTASPSKRVCTSPWQANAVGARVLDRDRPEDRLGTDIAGQYRLVAVLGTGGTGVVYLAEQRSVDREVAVKVLRRELAQDPDAVQRFLQEAWATSRLSHPHAIKVHDCGQLDDGTVYIAMERLRGGSLADLLGAEGRLAPARAVQLGIQVSGALAEAHHAGVVHRDLKPENIFVERVGAGDHAKVIDFGTAKLCEPRAGGPVTQAGTVWGSPAYMSPEQALSQPLDGRADIYSLGVVLYELLSGRRPFVDGSATGLLLKHVCEAPPPLPSDVCEAAGDALVSLLFRMLAKRPEDRLPRCEIVQMRLERIIAFGELGRRQASLQSVPRVARGLRFPAPVASAGETQPFGRASANRSGGLLRPADAAAGSPASASTPDAPDPAATRTLVERPWAKASGRGPRRRRRKTPTFKLEAARGRFEVDGLEAPMICHEIGLERCAFLIDPTVAPPAVGCTVAIELPAEPVEPGDVRVDGVVHSVQPAATRRHVAVEVELSPRAMSQLYRRVVQYWSVKSHAAACA